ncbi:cupin domain-containing protein [Halobium salinum]|uniref:Cupin domain-containing protein n=1 Tax=Halobium salinum TaxID=1364940 RepID=A0ABD5PB52_9EURY|nr:cupin domain-containing protein [Halobium salinum]
MSSTGAVTRKYDVDLGPLGAKLEVAAAENAAGVAVVEHTLPSRTLAAPLHRHSREDEISYVLEGEITVLADDEVSTYGEGEFVVKGRDVWHTFWNDGDEPLRFLEIIAPGGFATFFEEVAEFYPFDPADEATLDRFEALSERYGFEADMESIPGLCETYGLTM